MICPKCHTDNRSSAKYCDECGYELPTVAPVAREIFGVGGVGVAGAADNNGEDEALDYLESADTVGFDTVDLEFVNPEFSGVSPREEFDGRDEFGELDEFDACDELDELDKFEEIESADTVSLDDEYDDDFPGDAGETAALTSDVSAPSAVIPAATPAAPAGTSASFSAAPQGRTFYSSAADNSPAPRRKRKINKRLVAIIAAAVLLLAAGAAAVTYMMQLWGGKVVPDVVGAAQAEAIAIMEDAGFAVEIEEVVSDDAEGVVLATDPRAGARRDAGAVVVLQISIARVVPDVVGATLDEAQNLLAESGFTNVEVTYAKSNEAANTVLSVDPTPLTRASADTKITLEVAESYVVPEVSGMSRDDAAEALENEGYEVSVQRENSEDVAEGAAIRTDPAAGTALNSGQTVVLYIAFSRANELVDLTSQFFNQSSTLTIDGSPYELSRVTSVTYSSGNTCAFSIVVRPIQTVNWFGVQAETRYGSYETINGTISWSDSDEIASIDPAIEQGT